MKSKFFCDIRGTFNGGTNRQKSLTDFAYLLNNLDESEEIDFSFVSSDDTNTIKQYVNELNKYIKGSRVKFGKQYSCNKVIEKDKIEDIAIGKTTQIYLDLAGTNYDKVYYAEDSQTIRLATKKIIEKRYPNINLTLFATNNGIDSLNQSIEDYLSKNKSL